MNIHRRINPIVTYKDVKSHWQSRKYENDSEASFHIYQIGKIKQKLDNTKSW